MKETVRTTHEAISNLTAVVMKYCPSEYELKLKAAEAAKRISHCAAVLPGASKLGWQIETESLSTHAFTSCADPVSAQDYDWMFAECGDAAPPVRTFCEDLFDGRRVYAIVSAKDEETDQKLKAACPDAFPPCEMFVELLGMLAKEGATVRMLMGPGEKDGGEQTMLVSLPAQMTLRMRSIFSITFPFTEAVEIAADKGDVDTVLHRSLFLNGLRMMLYSIMSMPGRNGFGGAGAGASAETKKDGEDTGSSRVPDFSPFFDDDDDDDFGDADADAPSDKIGTPIERLGLSTRSERVLKRADINTVEKLRALPDDKLVRIRNLGAKGYREIKAKLEELDAAKKRVDEEAKVDHMALLDALVGLDEVKTKVRRIAAYARMKKDFAENGRKELAAALNMEFVGNPGTAKTTVARILAGILCEIGLVKSCELIEVGRGDIVGKYVGHTAVLVKETFAKARGKVLFIDEAYSLLDDQRGDFGDEAITTIVQEMENHRDDTIVIFAGYPEQMQRFIAGNPGLRSRVPFRVCFDDYSAEELTEIAVREASIRGFSIDADGRAKLADVCALAAGDTEMGNGRFCRNLVENSILCYAERVYGPDCEVPAGDPVLTADDIEMPNYGDKPEKKPIGFSA